MEYLGQFTDSPRTAEHKKQVLPRPKQGKDEHRVYFNFREETRVFEEETITVPVADFVACLSSSTPTDQAWRELLTANGYTEEQVTTILAE